MEDEQMEDGECINSDDLDTWMVDPDPEFCMEEGFAEQCAQQLVDGGACAGLMPYLEALAGDEAVDFDFNDMFDGVDFENLQTGDLHDHLMSFVEPLENLVIFLEAVSEASLHVDAECFECSNIGLPLAEACAMWTPPARNPLELLKHIIAEQEILAQLELPAGRKELNKLKNNYVTLSKSVKKSSKRVKKAIRNA